MGTCIEKRGWCEPGWEKKIVGTCIGRSGLWESLKGELGCGNLFSVCL